MKDGRGAATSASPSPQLHPDRGAGHSGATVDRRAASCDSPHSHRPSPSEGTASWAERLLFPGCGSEGQGTRETPCPERQHLLPLFQLPAPLRPGCAAGTEPPSEMGRVPRSRWPALTVCSTSVLVMQPLDREHCRPDSGACSPTPLLLLVLVRQEWSSHLQRPHRGHGSDQQPLPAPAPKHVCANPQEPSLTARRAVLGGRNSPLGLYSHRRNLHLPPIFRS